MKRVLNFLLVFLLCNFTYSQVTVWNNAGQPGNQAFTPPVNPLPGLISAASNLTRGSGISAPTTGAANSITSTGFVINGTSADPNEYYEFTVTPPTNSSLTLTEIVGNWQRSGTGPQTAELRVTISGVETFLNTAAIPATATGFSFTLGTTVENIITPITFRIYAFGGTNAAGTFRLSNALQITGSSIPLPIKLIAFDIKNTYSKAEINFSTASEINNSHFNIEHSLDGRNFDVIAEVKGAGNSSAKKDYSYTHSNPNAGINYYRLTQVDYDGKSETFEIKSIKIGKGNSFRAFPTETNDVINVEVSENTPINVFDLNGKLLLTTSNTDRISLGNFASGIYYIKSQGEIIKIRKI